MKKIIAASAVLAALSSGAMATDQNIDVTAEVPSFCSVGGVDTGIAVTNKLIDLGTIGSSGTSATATSVSLGTVTCNKAANATLISAKGALLGPSASGSMQNYINYNATTTGLQANASVPATLTTGTATSTSGAPAAQANAFSSTIGVSVTPVAAGPFVAGSYTDVLTFRIVPQ